VYRTIALTLVFGGIVMMALPWLVSHYYVGALTNTVVLTDTGDPALALDLTGVLQNSAVFGVLATMAGLTLGFVRARK
jgi:hypothetical protein